MTDTPIISIQDAKVTFTRDGQKTVALAGVSLDVLKGQFVALLGPSGCGKSTLLNLIAGLQAQTSGQVLYRGKGLSGPNTNVGYMTQGDTLLPWRSTAGNLQLPLEFRNVDPQERARRVAQALKRVELTDFEDHYPRELSGGMRKRLQLARSLIYDAECVLMDEPFAALDAQLRLTMHELLQRVWMETGKTIVFVTHDIDEAVALADRVVVMAARPGRIKAVIDIDIPRPRDVYAGRYDERCVAYQRELFALISEDHPVPTEA